MTFYAFGEEFTRKTGMLELMADLAVASKAANGTNNRPSRLGMLGGGNPARIPANDDTFGRIEKNGDGGFKYFVELDAVEGLLKNDPGSIGALRISRPNPSGNVLADAEICALASVNAYAGGRSRVIP